MKIFISYANVERHRAAEVQAIFDGFGFESFMAHENIQVSRSWRDVILNELEECDAVVCLISKEFLVSSWCLQESGIAGYRHHHEAIGLIPLSLDGETSPGCLAPFQSPRIKGAKIEVEDIVPGLKECMVESELIRALIGWAGKARGFRSAESRLDTLRPFFANMSLSETEELLQVSKENNQIWDASRCATEHLPEVIHHYDQLKAGAADSSQAAFIRDKVRNWL